MTIIFSEPTFGDKLLAILGKKRAAFIPDFYGRFGKYAYGRAVKESFLEALIRPKYQELEEGWFYQDEIMPGQSTVRKERTFDLATIMPG